MIIIGVDLETTGISEDENVEVVELGLVLFHVETKTILASMGKIYKAEKWSVEAAKFHGVSKESSDLMFGIPSSEDEDPFEIINGNLADYVVAHNAEHDHKYIKELWPSFLKKPWLCTQRDLRHEDILPRKVRSRRLGHLCVDYGIKLDNWHRAQADAEACARIAAEHDLNAAYAYKLLPKFRLITWGSQKVNGVNVNEKLREAPSVVKDSRRYWWNTDDYPKAWVKQYMLEEDVKLDVKYLKDITKGAWTYDVEVMDPKPY